MRSLVFVGPTLGVDAARAVLPEALYLPPARQGDVLSAVRNHRPDVIGLIDGLFYQSLSVWHKEILFALSEGVHVYGSSSIGALRAAECAPFGMVGVGAVFADYESGRLVDDDEVALAHGDAESGYAGLSVPMVNVRATLAAARLAGVIGDEDHDLIVETAKSLYFTSRTWIAALAPLPDERRAAVTEWVREHPVDQKARDAVELLTIIRDLPDDLPPPPQVEVTPSHVFGALRERDRRVRRGDAEATLEEVARFVMLHHAEGSELMTRALNRELVGMFAAHVGLEVTEEEIADEERRFRARRRLDDGAVEDYLERNDLDETEYWELMRQLATARRMRAWLAVRRYKLGLVRPLLDELRLADQYAEWADGAAAHESYLEQHPVWAEQIEVDDSEVPELLRDQARTTGWRPDSDLATWAEEAGFSQSYDVLVELKRAHLARQQRRRDA